MRTSALDPPAVTLTSRSERPAAKTTPIRTDPNGAASKGGIREGSADARSNRVSDMRPPPGNRRSSCTRSVPAVPRALMSRRLAQRRCAVPTFSREGGGLLCQQESSIQWDLDYWLHCQHTTVQAHGPIARIDCDRRDGPVPLERCTSNATRFVNRDEPPSAAEPFPDPTLQSKLGDKCGGQG